MTPKISQDCQSIDSEDGATTLMSEISLLSFTLTHEKSYIRKFLMNCILVVTSNTADTMEGVVFNGALSHARFLRPDGTRSTHLPQPFGWGHALPRPLRWGTQRASASTGPDVNDLSGTQLIDLISFSRNPSSFPFS